MVPVTVTFLSVSLTSNVLMLSSIVCPLSVYYGSQSTGSTAATVTLLAAVLGLMSPKLLTYNIHRPATLPRHHAQSSQIDGYICLKHLKINFLSLELS